MITVETSYTRKISCPIDHVNSIAYNGIDYALLIGHRASITRLGEDLCPIDTQSVARCYSCICFSTQECCYYACSQNNPSLIYKLDLNFNELDTMSIDCSHDKAPIAISVHPTSPLILLLYPGEIIYWNLMSGTIHNIIDIDQDKHGLDIIAFHKGFILSFIRENKIFLEIACSQCDKHKYVEIPCKYEYLAMTLLDICYENSEQPKNFIQLILSERDCHQQIAMVLQISCGGHEPSPHPGQLTCEGGKNEIIHSIALEEAGIAHILNAEGEKLQKAVASDTTIEELLLVNESVRKTITQITLLEGQLYSKLESLHCLCDEDSHDEH